MNAESAPKGASESATTHDQPSSYRTPQQIRKDQLEAEHAMQLVAPGLFADPAPDLVQGAPGSADMHTPFHRDAHLAGHETEWQAAKRSSVHRSRLRADEYEALKAAGDRGLTDSELQATFPDDPPGSCSKRRHDLVVAGLVKDSGITRRNGHGSNCIVWVVAK